MPFCWVALNGHQKKLSNVVDEILLQLVGGLSHHLQPFRKGLHLFQVPRRISSIRSLNPFALYIGMSFLGDPPKNVGFLWFIGKTETRVPSNIVDIHERQPQRQGQETRTLKMVRA